MGAKLFSDNQKGRKHTGLNCKNWTTTKKSNFLNREALENGYSLVAISWKGKERERQGSTGWPIKNYNE